MAKTDIATLNVRLAANTNEFTAGMANAQRRLEQTTAVVTKSRAAFSGLGSAMRMPGLGRGAALGGAASGVLGALGMGALGGGAAGLAATGAFLLVDGLIQRERRLAEAARETREQFLKGMAAIRARNAAFAETFREISLSTERDPLQRKVNDVRESARSQIGTLTQRIEELDRSLAATNPRTLAASNMRFEREQVAALIQKIAMQADADVNAMLRARPDGLGSRLSGVLAQDRDRGSAADVFNAISNALRAARDAAAMRAEADEATARAIRDAVADWKRENQKASDLLATTVGRISSQITQLTYRSN